MSSGSLALDDLERDALTELVNIGVSRAAASLRKMVNRQVILSVPSVEVVTRKSAAALIGQRENEDLIAVHQQFEGPFSGRALLIFLKAMACRSSVPSLARTWTTRASLKLRMKLSPKPGTLS